MSKGLGSTLANGARIIGAKIIAQKVANSLGYKDCGCDKRRDLLDKAIPYDKNIWVNRAKRACQGCRNAVKRFGS